MQSPLRLERLVRDADFGRGYQRDLYAQAWALVYFLRTQPPPKQFLTFYRLALRSRALTSGASPVSAGGDRVFGAFQRAFGTDMDRLEGRIGTSFMKGDADTAGAAGPSKSRVSGFARMSFSDPGDPLIASSLCTLEGARALDLVREKSASATSLYGHWSSACR